MKKWIALTLALVLALSLFAGCGKGADADETDYASMSIEELKPLLKTVTDGKLTVATSPDFAPYEFYSIDENENPTLAGFDIALAQYIADYLGLELEIIPMDFDGTLSELSAKKVDLALSGYSPDPAREDKMDFSEIYYVGGQSFVTVQDKADSFSTLADANKAEYQIGAQLGSIQADLAKENTPDADIVELFIIYYIVFGGVSLPSFKLFGFIRFERFLPGVISLALNSAAYLSEIIRAGIQSIDPGQSEAARSLGLTRRQTLQSIVLPQAIKNILPAIANEFVTIIKESSICYTIGVQEIMSAVNSVKSATFSIGEPLIIAACVYFCLTFPTSKIIQYFERRMSRGDRR